MEEPQNHTDDSASASQKIFKLIENYFPVKTWEYLFENMCLQEMVSNHLTKQLEMYNKNLSSFLHEVGKMRESLSLAYLQLAARSKGRDAIEKFQNAMNFLHCKKDSVGKRRQDCSPEEAVYDFYNVLYGKIKAIKQKTVCKKIVKNCIRQTGQTLETIIDFLKQLVDIFPDDAQGVFIFFRPPIAINAPPLPGAPAKILIKV